MKYSLLYVMIGTKRDNIIRKAASSRSGKMVLAICWGIAFAVMGIKGIWSVPAALLIMNTVFMMVRFVKSRTIRSSVRFIYVLALMMALVSNMNGFSDIASFMRNMLSVITVMSLLGVVISAVCRNCKCTRRAADKFERLAAEVIMKMVL